MGVSSIPEPCQTSKLSLLREILVISPRERGKLCLGREDVTLRTLVPSR